MYALRLKLFTHEYYILNKSENATLLILAKMAEERFLLQFLSLKKKKKNIIQRLVTTYAVQGFRASKSKKIIIIINR